MDRLNKAALYVLVGLLGYQAGKWSHKIIDFVGDTEFFDVFRPDDPDDDEPEGDVDGE